MQRYQRAGEIQAALEAIQSGAIVSAEATAEVSPPRITVLHSVRHAQVRKGDFLLLVGTTKGAFILRSNAQRSRWEVGGPYFHGHNVYAMAYDGRAGQHRIWASTQNYWGTLLRSSDDFGKSWTNPQQAPIRFPSETGVSLKNIWQIALGRAEEPNVLYCGVEPAALFETSDAGETWSLVRGLFDHPHPSPLDAGQWRSGAAHHCARPRRQPAHVRGHLSRRRIPNERWRSYLERAEPGRPRHVPAGQIPRVRAVRTQNRDASRSARTPFSAKSLGIVSL